jgi:hypothetical protein
MDKNTPEGKSDRFYFRNKVVQSLYFYSFIGLTLIVLTNLLFASIGLVFDFGVRDATWLLVALVISGLSLIGVSILAALTFAGGAEGMTLKRVKATEILRLVLRFLNLSSGAALLVTALLRDGEVDTNWDPLLQGYGLAILVIEVFMVLFSVWRIAWVKANPERYSTPAGKDYIEAKAPLVSKPFKASVKAAEKETIQPEAVDVKSEPKTGKGKE